MPARTKTPDQRSAIPDSRLVAQCLRGDQSAWSASIHRHAPTDNLQESLVWRWARSDLFASDVLRSCARSWRPRECVHDVGLFCIVCGGTVERTPEHRQSRRAVEPCGAKTRSIATPSCGRL